MNTAGLSSPTGDQEAKGLSLPDEIGGKAGAVPEHGPRTRSRRHPPRIAQRGSGNPALNLVNIIIIIIIKPRVWIEIVGTFCALPPHTTHTAWLSIKTHRHLDTSKRTCKRGVERRPRQGKGEIKGERKGSSHRNNEGRAQETNGE